MSAPPVLEPRLRFRSVLRRGLVYGAVLSPVVLLPVLLNPDQEAGRTYVAVLTGLGLVGGVAWLLVGLFFWACSGRDVRRWRDWRTVRGRGDSVTVMAPALVRTAAALLVLAGLGWCFYQLLDT